MRQTLRFLLAFCLLGGSIGSAYAIDPHLNSINPYGAQRGTTATLLFNGANVNDAPELLVYYPGITVAKLEVTSKDQLRATLTIAADCRLGEHGFRVRTASGISEFRTFWVGALPMVQEKEPNSEFALPQPIAMNSTVQGLITSEDVDYYVVECKKGQRLSVEVEGMRLGIGFFDPYVAILNDKRFELALGDDSPMYTQDCGCSILVPADGKYTVMVRDSAYTGSGSYQLHVGNFPRPTAVIPAGGKPGEELEVRFIGDPSGEIKQKIKLPAAGGDLFRAHCATADGINPSGMKFRIVDLPNANEVANANAAATALVGTAPGAFNGVVSMAAETDYLKFAAKKGQVYDFHCYARRLGSALDPVMHLSLWTNNAMGTYLAGNDDAIGPDSYFRITIPQDGEYVLWVHDHLKKGGIDYFYRIEITVPVASTSTGIPKVDGNNISNQDRQVISVPRGNRFATIVQANRADWGGLATIAFDKLPPGVIATADNVDPGQGVVPVVFEAKADAVLGGTLSDFQMKPTDPKVVATTRTALDVNFNIGLNNVPFHRHMTDRIAVAVTDVAPFSIDVVEPKSPLVQNGSMYLKVIAKRAPTFKGAITVYPLFTPPGTGIAGQTVIPEGATEALVYTNAAPNAAPRKWKTAFIAVATATGGPTPKPNDPTTAASSGPLWVSSQLFTVEIAPPFVVFAQDRSAAEQGQKTQIVCKVTTNTPFEGKAKATIVGLPAKVVATPIEFTKDQKELVFDLTTDKTSPAGKHGTYIQVEIVHNGEKLYHSVGGNELRIDVPLPPKVVAVAVAPPKPAAPVPAAVVAVAPPMPKRLTRLEQLRLEQEDREKALKAGQPAPVPVPAAVPKK